MIIDDHRRPVRPAIFLDQLAARWVASWNKRHPYAPVQPVKADDETLAPVEATAQQPVPEAAPTKAKLVLNFAQAAHVANAMRMIVPFRNDSGKMAFATPPSVERHPIAPEAIRPTDDSPTTLPAVLTSQKLSPVKYYRLTSSAEADLRDKWWTGSQCGWHARTYGRKPRAEHRIVTVCAFASAVSAREVRKAFAAYA
jgi:hypothetical protein